MKSLPLLLLALFTGAYAFLSKSCCKCQTRIETALTESANGTLASEGLQGVTATADHYRVTLNGAVGTEEEREALVAKVEAGLPAGTVDNQLTIGNVAGVAGAAGAAAVGTIAAASGQDGDDEAMRLAEAEKARKAEAEAAAALKRKQEEDAKMAADRKAEEEARRARLAAERKKQAEEEARLAAMKLAEDEKKADMIAPVPVAPVLPKEDPAAVAKAAKEAKAAEMAEMEKARLAREAKAKEAKAKADAEKARMAAAKAAEAEKAAKPKKTAVAEAPKRMEFSGNLANDIAKIPAITFRAGHVCVDPPDMWKVDAAVKALKAAGNDDVISIIGYADARGNAEANRKMAYRRAAEVRNILITRGIRRENIRTVNGGIIGDASDGPEATAAARKTEFRLGE